MSLDKTVELITKCNILKIDGKYYREITYRKNNKIVTKNIPVEDMFVDFIGSKVKIKIEVL